ncbi:MAG: ribosome small subunit-dependent GTPase A [Candidatus Eremiobacteraeota bacterium]|nr:ribosome small subunit-dependent GTPase A [Candidatus Eremiobacteraeota bacterium]MBC5820864.1 ribosome small subunit-dependent GTPase A [Candidatus Eremiobacteraeota bacterium]
MRDVNAERTARVVSVGRNAAWIAFDDESELRLAARRKNAGRLELVPGDVVRATPLDDGRVLIDAREPRSFALTRTAQNGRTKTMAANVDGIAIVAALARPPLRTAMIDELFAFARLHDVAAAVIFTKPDLAQAEGVDAHALRTLYEGLGYRAFIVNPKTGEGVPAITAALAHAHTLLIGQSGVGKSSLFRALGGSGAVGDVSKSGRGKQTTTAGRLHRFAAGFLIDSPGVGEFALWGYAEREIARGFVDFAPFVADCRFGDCSHRGEPACAVRRAVEAGGIVAGRYASYLAIVGRDEVR